MLPGSQLSPRGAVVRGRREEGGGRRGDLVIPSADNQPASIILASSLTSGYLITSPNTPLRTDRNISLPGELSRGRGVGRPVSPGDVVIRGEDGRPVAQWMLRGIQDQDQEDEEEEEEEEHHTPHHAHLLGSRPGLYSTATSTQATSSGTSLCHSVIVS